MKLKEIVSRLNLYKYTILTGENGILNTIKWVNIVETQEIAEFLEPFELAFITGVALTSENDLLSLIKKIKSKNGCGAVINIGPYIQEIPKEVVEYCNMNDFCLMTIPWEVRVPNVMRSITWELLHATRKNIEKEVLLSDALLNPKRKELYIDDLKKQHYETNGKFTIVVINICKNGSTIDEEGMDAYIYFAKSVCSDYDSLDFIMLEGQIVVVAANATKRQIKSVVSLLKNQLTKMLNKGEKLYFCIGTEESGIQNAYKSYRLARKTQGLYKAMDESLTVVDYDEIGFYKLLIAINDIEVIRRFYDSTVKVINDYDLYHNSDLFVVLEAYIKADGSVQAVAESMYIHRNTVNYKISKIAELTGRNLSHIEDRTTLHLGVISYYFIKGI